MVDDTLAWVNQVKATNPAKPWFVYFSAGAIHGPHHTPKAHRDKYKGKFDGGWDRYREETFARQKSLGVIPVDAKLTPRPAEIPAWDAQPEAAKRVYRRLMENDSGFLDHTDEQIGRLIGGLEKTGQMDNTLVLYIVGDNGTPVAPGPGQPATVKLFVNGKHRGGTRREDGPVPLQRGAVRRGNGQRVPRVRRVPIAVPLQGADRAGQDRAQVTP